MNSDENLSHRQYSFSLLNIVPWQTLRQIRWKNKRASGREAYSPTEVEHLANVITHGIWVIPSVWAWCVLLHRASSPSQILSALVYGATLVLLFAVSTWFHSVFYCNRDGQLKDVLHRCDRAMIYVFIAGSYFPWLTVLSLPSTGWAPAMRWFVWVLAALGIIYQQIFHERYKSLETLFYLVMGVGPALPIICEHEFSGMSELKIGGLVYVLGVVFFKADGSIPCAHAIWHIFVVCAAGIHYYAILSYLYPDPISGFEVVAAASMDGKVANLEL